MGTLRAGLIGLGMMGRHHARNLQNLEGVELVAVADTSGDVSNVCPGMPILENIDQLIDTGLDYCVVALPTVNHLEAGLKLAEAGVHALIEKPLALDQESCLKLAEAFGNKGLIAGVGHIERYNPAIQELKAKLKRGDLGEIYQVTTRRQGPYPARIADVGVIKDLASHDFDLTRWITGSKYSTMSANVINRSTRSYEDMMVATGLLKNNVITSHVVNWLTPNKERRTVVTGERGMFVADTLTADLTFYENATSGNSWEGFSYFRGVAEGDVRRFSIPKPEPLQVEHTAFRDAIVNNDTSGIVSLAEGFEIVRVCEAAIESAKTRETIHLVKD